MPQSGETRTQSSGADAVFQAFAADLEQKFKDDLTAVLKQQGFTKTLKFIKKAEETKLSPNKMMAVYDGVGEELPSGEFNLSLDTDKGPKYFHNVQPRGHVSADPQLVPSSTGPSLDSSVLTPAQLLQQLEENPSCRDICLAELTRFDPSQHQVLLPLLWRYILAHRNSNGRDELVAVGAAIRKYIAVMPMDRMGELAVLLESGSRSPLPIELEIEVAKMIYRNFEVYPPTDADPQPELAQRLLEIVQVYTNPRILLKDKHSAAASLAIEAIVSMRSPLAEQALQAAVACPYGWFTELVSDDLDDLNEQWDDKSPDAATWLRELRDKVLANV